MRFHYGRFELGRRGVYESVIAVVRSNRAPGSVARVFDLFRFYRYLRDPSDPWRALPLTDGFHGDRTDFIRVPARVFLEDFHRRAARVPVVRKPVGGRDVARRPSLVRARRGDVTQPVIVARTIRSEKSSKILQTESCSTVRHGNRQATRNKKKKIVKKKGWFSGELYLYT